MSSTTPTIGATRTRPPATTIAAVALQVLIGTVTSFGGLYFGLQAGGAWIVSATLFAAACPPTGSPSAVEPLAGVEAADQNG